MSNFSFLKQNEVPTILEVGKTILGISVEELGEEYVTEFDISASRFENYLQGDIHKLMWMINLRLLSLMYTMRITPFKGLSSDNQIKFIKKMMTSRIPLLRTSFTTLKALCAWSYYSSERSWDEMGYLGSTIGREKITPTLLFEDPKSAEEKKS